MPESFPKSGEFTRSATSIWKWALGVGVVALAVFGYRLPAEPHFVDESAYYSQTYYADLWGRGDFNNPAWLEYPAYDLPPLPKYLIGGALFLGGYPRPGRLAAQQWYFNTSSRFESRESLTVARIPSVLLGALGVVAVFGLGVQLRDVPTGVVAAAVVMFNPLYYSHARRAMSDVPAEAFILATLAVALWSWQRLLSGNPFGLKTWCAVLLAGILGGLASESKLNGALALIIVLAWAGFALALPGLNVGKKLAIAESAGVVVVMGLLTFVALNPFLTARPTVPVGDLGRLNVFQRARKLVDHRMMVSKSQQQQFAHNAVTALPEKLKVVAVQGFGRFGPFGPRHSDSTVRYAFAQDWGALLWLPAVVAGGCWAWARGRAQYREARPPVAWAVLLQAAVAFVVVTAYLPLAWDRYFLSLQSGSALVVAGGAVALVDVLRRPPRSGPAEV